MSDYNDQIRELTSLDSEEHKELIATICKFRDEEQEHHDIGLENDAELAPAYQLLSGGIKVRKKSTFMCTWKGSPLKIFRSRKL